MTIFILNVLHLYKNCDLKHTYAEALIDRYQRRYGGRGLRTNEFFRDKGLEKGFLGVHDTQYGVISDRQRHLRRG